MSFLPAAALNAFKKDDEIRPNVGDRIFTRYSDGLWYWGELKKIYRNKKNYLLYAIQYDNGTYLDPFFVDGAGIFTEAQYKEYERQQQQNDNTISADTTANQEEKSSCVKITKEEKVEGAKSTKVTPSKELLVEHQQLGCSKIIVKKGAFCDEDKGDDEEATIPLPSPNNNNAETNVETITASKIPEHSSSGITNSDRVAANLHAANDNANDKEGTKTQRTLDLPYMGAAESSADTIKDLSSSAKDASSIAQGEDLAPWFAEAQQKCKRKYPCVSCLATAKRMRALMESSQRPAKRSRRRSAAGTDHEIETSKTQELGRIIQVEGIDLSGKSKLRNDDVPDDDTDASTAASSDSEWNQKESGNLRKIWRNRI